MCFSIQVCFDCIGSVFGLMVMMKNEDLDFHNFFFLARSPASLACFTDGFRESVLRPLSSVPNDLTIRSLGLFLKDMTFKLKKKIGSRFSTSSFILHFLQLPLIS